MVTKGRSDIVLTNKDTLSFLSRSWAQRAQQSGDMLAKGGEPIILVLVRRGQEEPRDLLIASLVN